MPIDSFDAEIVVTSDRGDERSMEVSTGIGGVRLALWAGDNAVDALMSPVSTRALAMALNMAAAYQETHYESDLTRPCCECVDPRPYDPRCACLECGCGEMNYPSCECNSPRVPGHRCDE